MLLSDLRNRIFQNPFPTREGRVNKSLQERTTMTSSLHTVCHPTLAEEKMANQKLPYSLLPSSENVSYRVRICWHLDMLFAMCLSPNVSKLQGRAWSDFCPPSTSWVRIHAWAARTLMSTLSISHISGGDSVSTKVDN